MSQWKRICMCTLAIKHLLRLTSSLTTKLEWRQVAIYFFSRAWRNAPSRAGPGMDQSAHVGTIPPHLYSVDHPLWVLQDIYPMREWSSPGGPYQNNLSHFPGPSPLVRKHKGTPRIPKMVRITYRWSICKKYTHLRLWRPTPESLQGVNWGLFQGCPQLYRRFELFLCRKPGCRCYDNTSAR